MLRKKNHAEKTLFWQIKITRKIRDFIEFVTKFPYLYANKRLSLNNQKLLEKKIQHSTYDRKCYLSSVTK